MHRHITRLSAIGMQLVLIGLVAVACSRPSVTSRVPATPERATSAGSASHASADSSCDELPATRVEEWTRKAHALAPKCAAGDAHACYDVGIVYYYDHEGIAGNPGPFDHDHHVALRFFAHGCDLRSQDHEAAHVSLIASCCELAGEILMRGTGVPVDLERARHVLDAACQAQPGTSCVKLSQITTDPKSQRQLLARACSGGAMTPLGGISGWVPGYQKRDVDCIQARRWAR